MKETEETRATLEGLQRTYELIKAGEIVLKCMLTRQKVPKDVMEMWESRKNETNNNNNT